VKGTATLGSLQAAGQQRVSVKMNMAEAQAFAKNKQGNPWRRQHRSADPTEHPELLAFTQQACWGPRVTDLEVHHLAPDVQAALAPGTINMDGGLLDDIAKTYQFQLCDELYKELAKAPSRCTSSL
jgi:hypothetical protein